MEQYRRKNIIQCFLTCKPFFDLSKSVGILLMNIQTCIVLLTNPIFPSFISVETQAQVSLFVCYVE